MSKKPPSGLPLNVLLLLSHDQLPPPDEELASLDDACKASQDGSAHLATTRSLRALASGAEIAFYVDGQDRFRLLATAEFDRFIPIESSEAESILDQNALYGARQLKRMRGLVQLRGVHLRRAGSTLESLNGWMADGVRLSLSNIPAGHRRSSVYYVKTQDSRGPSLQDRIRLYQAKVEELEDKYDDTRGLMDRASAQQAQVLDEKNRQIRSLMAAEERGTGGRSGQLSLVLLNTYRELFPNLRFLDDSASTLLKHYARHRSIVARLAVLNSDPMLALGLRDGKALVGVHGWFEARFGDSLGRLYYRRVGTGRDIRVVVLISLKTWQERDVRRLQALKDSDLLRQ